jgi:hypothetical protein
VVIAASADLRVFGKMLSGHPSQNGDQATLLGLGLTVPVTKAVRILISRTVEGNLSSSNGAHIPQKPTHMGLGIFA